MESKLFIAMKTVNFIITELGHKCRSSNRVHLQVQEDECYAVMSSQQAGNFLRQNRMLQLCVFLSWIQEDLLSLLHQTKTAKICVYFQGSFALHNSASSAHSHHRTSLHTNFY